MAYPSTSQVAQPCTNQDVFEISQLDSVWPGNSQCCGSYDLLPCLLNHQCSQIHVNPISNSTFISSQPLETWDDELGFSVTVPENPLLQIQPAVQSTATEQSGGEQGLKQVVSNLEGRIDRLAELIENLRNE
jgi:hypothetical protein